MYIVQYVFLVIRALLFVCIIILFNNNYYCTVYKPAKLYLL